MKNSHLKDQGASSGGGGTWPADCSWDRTCPFRFGCRVSGTLHLNHLNPTIPTLTYAQRVPVRSDPHSAFETPRIALCPKALADKCIRPQLCRLPSPGRQARELQGGSQGLVKA